MAGTTYQDLLKGVANYYGSGSDQWAEIAKYGVTPETLPIIEQVPGVNITKSISGKYLGYDYINPFTAPGNPASSINSNLQTGAYGNGAFSANVPATAVTNAETGLTTMESGAKAVSTGAKVASVANKVFLGVAVVSAATKLGKFIDETIYKTNPDWWDENFPTINPETWDDIASTEGGKNVIRSIFGLQGDNTTMYMDERMLAYAYMGLLKQGAWESGGKVTPPEDFKKVYPQWDVESLYCGDVAIKKFKNGEQPDITALIKDNTEPVYLGFMGRTTSSGKIGVQQVSASKAPYKCTNNYEGNDNNYSNALSITKNNRTYYSGSPYGVGSLDNSELSIPLSEIRAVGDGNLYAVGDVWAYAVLYGTISEGIDGINNNPNANLQITPDTVINPTTGKPVIPNDNPSDVLDALKQKYPELFLNSIYEDVPQPDGTTQRITYVPTPYPNTENPTQPVTDNTPGVNPQTNPEIKPGVQTPDVIQDFVDNITIPPTPPDTGGGNTPSVIVPSGTANALYSIYNPSQDEINSFGAWLWSNNFVDQLLKLFNDPMQAIIGLHKIFATPTISGKGNIKVGYLDSGVPSNLVSNQYTTIDCGTVNLFEYFGNVFDYEPFTQVYIYLPFIGIEKLNTGEVMRGSINVVYHIDVLTGACLVEVNVSRDGAGGTLYTYSGDCSVHYPISSGSYMGIVASLASVVGGVIGTVASGGAIAPLALGAVNGALNTHTQVQHSGGFSGNFGAMGIKKPYLIIVRPQTCLANTFPSLDGYPANKSTTIGDCSGFIKCESCHVSGVSATDAELSEIETLLKNGVMI